jgi:hypothetical protein
MAAHQTKQHSYVPFYMNDWDAATAGLPRAAWSTLFQVCIHNWKKLVPVPRSRLMLMVSDLGADGAATLQALLEAGLLKENEDGVYSERAMGEGQKAFDLWKKKSTGGSKSHGRVPKESSRTRPADIDSDLDSSSPNGKEDSSPSETRQSVVDAWNEMAGQNDLAQVRAMTDARTKSLKARIKEHGAETLIEHIGRIPQYPFLLGKSETGWKANFDWLLQPSSCTKLIEGAYARGKGKSSAWTQ